MREFLDSLLDFSPMIFPFLRLLLIFVLGLWTLRLVDSALKRIAQIVPADEAHRARINHRTLTLRHFVRSFGKAVLGVLIVILLTSELGLNLAPLLAGAGIAGLAIGFGAQSLVKDVISGFFVLLEDQYGVGESVRIGLQEGVVEEMTLRVTVLRNGEGEVHVIPNGSIQTVTVLSRDWRRAVVDIEVSAREELGRTFGVLARLNDALAKDMYAAVIEKPAIVGIERMTGTGITIRLAARTLPSKQADVAHEWRRRIKETFDREGIRLAESPLVQPGGLSA
jgi:small-conductance mechanosensitive channel